MLLLSILVHAVPLLQIFSFPLAKGCDVLFLKEPPPGIHCNPYSFAALLVLECQVQIPASVGSKGAIIQWIFQDSRNANNPITKSLFAPLYDTNHQRTISGQDWLLQTRITLDGTALTSPDHHGLYFCQLLLNGSSVTVVASSTGLTIEDEEHGPSHYLNFHPCTEVPQYLVTMRCAGNITKSEESDMNFRSRPTIMVPSTLTEHLDTGGTELIVRDLNPGRNSEYLIYVMVIVVLSLLLCGIAVLLAVFWLGHQIKRSRTVDATVKSPTTTTKTAMGSQWSEINLPIPEERTKYSVNTAYDVIAEPDYVEIM